jgi:hypothetical protein
MPSCSSLCEDNFISIYHKFDEFSERIIHSLNKTSLTNEIKQMVDEMSLALIIKTKLNMQKISHQHARLQATSQVLENLLRVDNLQADNTDNLQIKEVRHIQGGLNVYQFVILMIVFLGIGINVEIIRSRRSKYTEIL